MKNISRRGFPVRCGVLAAFIAVAVLSFSCQDPIVPEIKVNSESYEYQSTGGNLKVPVSSNVVFEVIIQQEGSWLTLESSSTSDIKLKIARNEGYVERVATVCICHDGEVYDKFTVTQLGLEPQLEYEAPANATFLLGAYFPYYRGVSEADFADELLSHVDVAYYAFAYLKDDCQSTYIEQVSKLQTLVRRCHAKNIPVLLSFSGTSSKYKAMVRSGAKRTKFVEQMVQYVKQYDLDGIDNDWEFPSSSDDSKHNNVLLMRQLSNALHAPGVNKLLTMAVTSGRWAGNYRDGIDDEIFRCCDWINAMCYNDVSGDYINNYDAMSVAYKSYDYWVGTRHMDPKKYSLGLPLYSTSPSNKAYSYRTILANGGSPDKDSFFYNSEYNFYNGRPTIIKKMHMMRDSLTAGAFFWEASYDVTGDNSLILTAAAAKND